MNKPSSFKVSSSSVYKGFYFKNNLANALHEVASNELSGKYEADIAREGIVEWINKRYPLIAQKYKLV